RRAWGVPEMLGDAPQSAEDRPQSPPAPAGESSDDTGIAGSAAPASVATMSEAELIAYVGRCFNAGSYFEGLFAIAAGYVRPPNGTMLDELFRGVHHVENCQAVLSAAARALGWDSSSMASLHGPGLISADDVRRYTAWLYEVAPRQTGQPDEPSETLLA